MYCIEYRGDESNFIIEELLAENHFDIKEKVENIVLTLLHSGQKLKAQKILLACKKYGIKMPEIITETYYNV